MCNSPGTTVPNLLCSCVSSDECVAEDYMKKRGSWYLISGGCYSTSSSTKDTRSYVEGWKVDPNVNATWTYKSEDELDGCVWKMQILFWFDKNNVINTRWI